jgi:hypothetical protein
MVLLTLLYGIIFLCNDKSFVAAEEEEEKYDLEINVVRKKVDINGKQEYRVDFNVSDKTLEKCLNEEIMTVYPKDNATFANKNIKNIKVYYKNTSRKQ